IPVTVFTCAITALTFTGRLVAAWLVTTTLRFTCSTRWPWRFLRWWGFAVEHHIGKAIQLVAFNGLADKLFNRFKRSEFFVHDQRNSMPHLPCAASTANAVHIV